jgi:hypothetical protein
LRTAAIAPPRNERARPLHNLTTIERPGGDGLATRIPFPGLWTASRGRHAQVVEEGNHIHYVALGSRTEITDAAIARRAERVMLNRGSNRNRAAGKRGSA